MNYRSASSSAAPGAPWPRITPTAADIAERIRQHQPVRIRCYGDSLTYGQDEKSERRLPPINGASQTRSMSPYPETLLATFVAAGFDAVIVRNCGYPGDNAAAGLKRWDNEFACDLAYLMYGSNDANNYGLLGFATVEEFEANLRAMIAQLVGLQVATVLVLPPPTAFDDQNDRLQPFLAAARALAANYKLVLFDAAEILGTMTVEERYLDGVHLSPAAAARLGEHLARHLLTS